MSEPENITYGDVKASPTVETPLPTLSPIGAGPLVHDDMPAKALPAYTEDIEELTERLLTTIRAFSKHANPASQRAASIAITHLETGKMWAVRARYL
jgi:hypothetical protein